MPSLQNISYNSSRVQRAYRINNIEALRLQNRIQLLEKERLHTQRLANQDIRLISVTLDYIQTHSGHSAEGLPPDGIKIVTEEEREDEGPTFMYGERIVSRKKRRTLRPQSAMDKSSSRLDSETASTISTLEFTPRPQSSPPKRTTFVTHLKDRDDDSVFGAESECSTSSSCSVSARFKPAWTEEPMPEISKILLRSASGQQKRDSIFNRDPSAKVIARIRRLSQSGMPVQNDPRAPDRRPSSCGPGLRSSTVTDIINKAPKAVMSASAWKSHLNSSQMTPQSTTSKREYIMDTKKAINYQNTRTIQKKVKKFVARSDLT